ncbi:MAG: DUF424 domain-containing protein [Candidatus Thorarchaeota archaeon]|jgi:hypothetical protein
MTKSKVQKFYIKIHPRMEHYVVAICDEPLLGKILTEGDIKFNISEEFYGGELVDMDTCLEHLKQATIANMIGSKTVEAAINAGLIHKQSVLYIEGEPHAQWVKL